MDRALEGVDWFVGNTFSGADIQLSFVVEITPLLHPNGSFPNLAAMRARFQQRPAYQRALKKGGKYDFGPAGAVRRCAALRLERHQHRR